MANFYQSRASLSYGRDERTAPGGDDQLVMVAIDMGEITIR